MQKCEIITPLFLLIQIFIYRAEGWAVGILRVIIWEQWRDDVG